MRNDSLNFDSIFALATALSTSALHLHRISGPLVFELLSPYFLCPVSGRRFLQEFCSKNQHILSSKSAFVRYAHLVDAQGNLIDDVVLSVFCAPRSYTGENTLEISTHGNPFISLKLQSFFRSLGLRDALPGEFTQRAVLHGKLDLAQAEGVQQLIHAETPAGLLLARQTLEGALSQETRLLRDHYVELLSYLEAHIDFSADEVGTYRPCDLLPQMKKIQTRLFALLESYGSGLKVREGLRIVLIGKPNTGKSSLYNSLLRYEKAIVTDIPGTTRDILEEKLLIENKDFILTDTAGIHHETTDIVEKIGVEKSLKYMKEADIICFLIEWQNEVDFEKNLKLQFDNLFYEKTLQKDQKIIFVLSKEDLLTEAQIEKIHEINTKGLFIFDDKFKSHIFVNKIILNSIQNTSSLCTQLVQLHDFFTQKVIQNETPTLISMRQKDKITLSLKYLEEAFQLISLNEYPEKIASTLHYSKQALEEMIGEICLEDIMGRVFSTFCVGK